ncbi:hypothetical protein BB559_007375 [Furculomyces boomerangus]|uniref:Uncharacterized protein n=2 Tax=Harpellales TaxID=61421 RepID=A0A2T9XXM1_9FUNG|nr:hypothetical protein BB559_007375 [Furculomyces boomerangus]PVZ97106.1 hypothetical protein BB558_006959 [Smittium angustum]PVZ97658.1 hypothetical protein BB558_006371 [Smittium angustum]PVZ98772.1 hypothetical protein BB558_005224 [Smittium angustum]
MENILELKVLKAELENLNPKARVYQKRSSGNVLFLSSRESTLKETQSKINNAPKTNQHKYTN